MLFRSGSIQLAKLAPQRVRVFLNEKLATPQPSRKKVKPGDTPEPGKPLSPRTVKHLLVTLRGALESAVKDGLIPRNVAAVVDPPSIAKPQMKTFSAEQARTFLDALAGDRLEALFSTAIALAYRQGEALGLQWPDVDLVNSTLTVRQSIQRIDGKLTITPTKKDRVHTVNLPAVTRSVLVAHRAKQGEEKRLAGSRWQETGFVFTTTIGNASGRAQRDTPLSFNPEGHRLAAHQVPRSAPQRSHLVVGPGCQRAVHQ